MNTLRILRHQNYRMQTCWMDIMLLIATFILLAPTAPGQPAGAGLDRDRVLMTEERYGPHSRNTFDIVLPTSGTPTPLVIYIHGGGFVQGDKSEAFRSRWEDVEYFLKHMVAFATINYRYQKTNDSLGVRASLEDIRTALQYIRHHARRYNIDERRVACYGSSAGAGSALYLAFHDDFARANDTTLLGESTRIRCAGALATQATYDVLRWLDFIPGLQSVPKEKKDQLQHAAANFYGYPDYQAFEPHRERITCELDMLQMISADDPPVYIMNLQQSTGVEDMGAIQHHRAHAVVLSSHLKRKSVTHETYLHDNKTKVESDIRHPVREFLLRHLH